MNSQLLILAGTMSLFVIFFTIVHPRVTMIEGIIVTIISNIFIVIVWTISINILIADEYIQTFHAKDISITRESLNVCSDDSECIPEYRYTWYAELNKRDSNDSIKLHELVTTTPAAPNTPSWILDTYKSDALFEIPKKFSNIYNNLGVYSGWNSTFKINKPTDQVGSNNVESVSDEDVARISKTIKKYNTTNKVIHIIFTNTSDLITNTDIKSKWGGLVLNELLIHVSVDDYVISGIELSTYGANIGNDDFINIFKNEFSYTNGKLADLLSTIDKYHSLYSVPDDTYYNNYIKEIQPGILRILTMLILNMMLTYVALQFMIKYNRDNDE